MPQIAIPFLQRPLPRWFSWATTIIGASVAGLMLGVSLYFFSGILATLTVAITGSYIPTFIIAIGSGLYALLTSPSESKIKQYGYALFGAGAIIAGLESVAIGGFSPLILAAYIGTSMTVLLYEKITTVRQMIRSPLKVPEEATLKALAHRAAQSHSHLSKYADAYLNEVDDASSEEDELYQTLKPYLLAEKRKIDTAVLDLDNVRKNHNLQYSRPLKTISAGLDENGHQRPIEKEVVQKRMTRVAQYLDDYTQDKVMWPLALDTLIWFKLKYIEQSAKIRVVDERLSNIKNYALKEILPALRAYLGAAEPRNAKPDWNAVSAYSRALDQLMINTTPEGQPPKLDDPYGARESLHRMVDDVEQHMRELQRTSRDIPARYQGSSQRTKPAAPLASERQIEPAQAERSGGRMRRKSTST